MLMDYFLSYAKSDDDFVDLLNIVKISSDDILMQCGLQKMCEKLHLRMAHK